MVLLSAWKPARPAVPKPDFWPKPRLKLKIQPKLYQTDLVGRLDLKFASDALLGELKPHLLAAAMYAIKLLPWLSVKSNESRQLNAAPTYTPPIESVLQL